MSETSIEWTHRPGTKGRTWNPTRGCTEIAEGCKRCYAKTFAERFRNVPGHPYEQGFDPRIVPDKLDEPLRLKHPCTFFVNSMSDLFHEEFPFDYIAAVWAVMALSARHTFLILTKRPGRALAFFRWLGEDPKEKILEAASKWLDVDDYDALLERAEALAIWPLPNVEIGVSIATQPDADVLIPLLLRIPAAIRFLSVEPLLGPVRLDVCAPHILGGDTSNPGVVNAFSGMAYHPATIRVAPPTQGTPAGISWVIVGGESGPGARPMHPMWVLAIRDQCVAAGVAFFFKQWGAWYPNSQFTKPGKAPKVATHWFEETDAYGPMVSYRVGKHAAGRLLDGREWNEFPEVQ